jgi:hypothetical protein
MEHHLLTFVFVLCFSGGLMALEEPKFDLIKKTDIYEIRSYKSAIVAETKVEAGFEDAGNKAFKILADYIFGNNRSRTKMDMTAPVSQAKSEKIAMTAPVGMKKDKEGFLVQFTMPSKFTLQTLALPNDSRVTIREIPPRKVAVLRYSGSWSEKNYQKKLSQLQSALKKDKIITRGEPVFARFNPPFWPPLFMRRNEIWIEIAAD